MKDTLPVAPYAYFRIINLDKARKEFLDNPTVSPKLQYDTRYSDALQIHMVSNGGEQGFSSTIDLVMLAIKLRLDPTPVNLTEYRSLNKQLYGEPDNKLAYAILKSASEKRQSSYGLDEIMHVAMDKRFNDVKIYKPKEEIFKIMQGYLNQYMNQNVQPSDSVQEMIKGALVATGLDKKGWRMRVTNDSRHAATIHATKEITIGDNFCPRTYLGATQIAVHEVYGHALRGKQETIAESEGFAVMLEQLVLPGYSSRRSYRFLAAALGWGTIGKPMNFPEVYDILWRVIVSNGKYNESQAKQHAFAECIRVFRGANPDIRGAVFLKDSLYYQANVAMWKKFETEVPTYSKFVDIIEGRKRVLR